MRLSRIVFAVIAFAMAFAPSIRAQETEVFAAALKNVRQELHGAPPMNERHPRDMTDLPAEAIAVAQRTIGGAPQGYRTFVDRWFGRVIAEELVQSYGEKGPSPRKIEQTTAAGFAILPLDEFEAGAFGYDWQRLNQKYPNIRYVVRLSWPLVDRIGTYAVVRYELVGRDRPSTVPANQPWQWGAFVKFEKQPDGSWRRGIGQIGNIWN